MVTDALTDDEFKIMEEYNTLMVEIERRTERRRKRIFQVAQKIKGDDFVKDLIEVIEDSGFTHGFTLVKTPGGQYQNEDFKTIPGIYVDQYRNGGMTGDDFAGYCYVQLKENKFIKFHYEM
jgi:hypothetical protein